MVHVWAGLLLPRHSLLHVDGVPGHGFNSETDRTLQRHQNVKSFIIISLPTVSLSKSNGSAWPKLFLSSNGHVTTFLGDCFI